MLSCVYVEAFAEHVMIRIKIAMHLLYLFKLKLFWGWVAASSYFLNRKSMTAALYSNAAMTF